MTSELRKQIIIKKIKIWLIAIAVTFSVIWLQAYFGRMLLDWIGIEMDLFTAILIAIITNFLFGLIKALKYGKIEIKKENS